MKSLLALVRHGALLVVLAVCITACAVKPGVNSDGTPTTAAEQVAGDALTAYNVADYAWLKYLQSPLATLKVVQAVEPYKVKARAALDAFSVASVTSNTAAAQSAFNSALAAWISQMATAGVPNTPAPPK